MKTLQEFATRQKWEEYVWGNIAEQIFKAKSQKRVRGMLEAILSDYERKNIIMRVIAISLIRQGKSYREIGKVTWLTPATISAIKKNMLQKHRYKSGRQHRKGRPGRAYTSTEPIQYLFLDWFNFPTFGPLERE